MNETPQQGPRPLSAAAVEALLLDTTPWLSCDDCFERMDAYAEELLRARPHHDPGMDRHLQGCPACREEVDSLLALLTGGTD
ncbi:MAG TPA: hypothetical protein VFJ97_13615 [Dermatophilaceae bacterium]|nr:hypothetical protein [Dermatophilaceae bacterium]